MILKRMILFTSILSLGISPYIYCEMPGNFTLLFEAIKTRINNLSTTKKEAIKNGGMLACCFGAIGIVVYKCYSDFKKATQEIPKFIKKYETLFKLSDSVDYKEIHQVMKGIHVKMKSEQILSALHGDDSFSLFMYDPKAFLNRYDCDTESMIAMLREDIRLVSDYKSILLNYNYRGDLSDDASFISSKLQHALDVLIDNRFK